jgi:hypothetical protein
VKILPVTLFRKRIRAFWYRHMATCDSKMLVQKTMEKIDQGEGRKFGTEILMELLEQSLK